MNNDNDMAHTHAPYTIKEINALAVDDVVAYHPYPHALKEQLPSVWAALVSRTDGDFRQVWAGPGCTDWYLARIIR